MAFCTKCGTVLKENDRFCTSCGQEKYSSNQQNVQQAYVPPTQQTYQQQPEEKPSVFDKIYKGASVVLLALVGGFYTIAGILILSSTQNWLGILIALYGIYVISGVFTGGKRLLLY